LIEAVNGIQKKVLRSFPMQLKVKLSKSQKIFLVAVLLSVGVGGVTAATTIGINNEIPLNLGVGYSTSATCDPSIDIASIRIGTNASNYRYAGFTLTNVDGVNCGGQVLRLAAVDKNNVTQQASWVIPSNATNYTYILGTTNLGLTISTNIYARYSYASIDISDLNKFGVSIGKF
jgi:hypothetical protein